MCGARHALQSLKASLSQTAKPRQDILNRQKSVHTQDWTAWSPRTPGTPDTRTAWTARTSHFGDILEISTPILLDDWPGPSLGQKLSVDRTGKVLDIEDLRY